MARMLVMYRWISQPTSARRRWAVFRRAREQEQETLMFRLILAPLPSDFGDPEQERRRVSSFLRYVLECVRIVTYDFTELPVEEFDRFGDLLAYNVLSAELMMRRSRRTPGTSVQQETTPCLLCESPVAESIPRRRNPTPVGVLRDRRHRSSGFWTLLEISFHRSWLIDDDDDDDDSPPRLCAVHASEFCCALETVLAAFAVPPDLTRDHRRSV